MKNILILPEESDSYRALSGDKESTGRTPGQALDALTSQLTEEESGTLVILQRYMPDRFFDAGQQKRLADLMRLREAGSLTAEDEGELESLVEAELRGAAQRAEAMSDAVGQTGSTLTPHEDSYVARVAQECLRHEEEVRRHIMTQTDDHDLAGDVVAAAIQRVIEYAKLHGLTKEIYNVISFLTFTARDLLIDTQARKLKAAKVETKNRDNSQGAEVMNTTVDEQLTETILSRIETDELMRRLPAAATAQQKELFHLYFVEGLHFKEIAELLQISEDRVRLEIYQARASMKRRTNR